MSSLERPKRFGTRRILELCGQLIALGIVLAQVALVVAPIFADLSTLGGHDWDEKESQRHLVVKTIHEYGQFPFWNPYACGGHSAWASIQGGTSLVSLFLPVYLLLDFKHALRVEVVGAALLAATGTWLLAGRFTRSGAARAFACVVWVVNGRWALQASVGHVWHLYYAWVPWLLFLCDGAWTSRGAPHPLRFRYVVGAGVCWAMMVYNGAIYPLPHAALLLSIYSVTAAIVWRTLKPLQTVALSGIIGGGLAAPKLIPLLEELSRYPRLVESREVIDLNGFVQLLVARSQTVGSRPAHIVQWGWHEYGMYIGWIAVLALAISAIAARTPAERGWRWAGLCTLLLGFGYFHEYSPWALLHQLPIFKSQHVPSRWLYSSALALALVSVSVLERLLERAGRARLPLEWALLPVVGFIAYDIASEARMPMAQAFWMRLPPVAVSDTFVQHGKVPSSLQYPRPDYAPPALPAQMANVGVIDCTLHPGLNIWARDAQGNAPGLGAIGREDSRYRGEVFTVSGQGEVAIDRFTPNEIEVTVRGAKPGDRVALNQNYNPGWRVNGQRADNYKDVLSTTIASPQQHFVFKFRPHLLLPSLGVFFVTLSALILAWRRPRLLSRLRRKPIPST
ncbi:MAG TPA: hypothetical protein VI072_01800 [Polyangiaceae bacterium]